MTNRLFPLIAALLLLLCFSSCSGRPSHPCQEAGDPAREQPFRGNRQCTQHKNKEGHYVNHGEYREWYPNGRLALEGYYSEGHKDGRWIEYSPDGRKIAEKYFEDGVEVSIRPTAGKNSPRN